MSMSIHGIIALDGGIAVIEREVGYFFYSCRSAEKNSLVHICNIGFNTGIAFFNIGRAHRPSFLFNSIKFVFTKGKAGKRKVYIKFIINVTSGSSLAKINICSIDCNLPYIHYNFSADRTIILSINPGIPDTMRKE